MKHIFTFLTLKLGLPLLMVFFSSAGLFAQTTIFEEHFTNLPLGAYKTKLAATTSFDNTTGWTYKNISVPEAGALCIGVSGSSGAFLQTPTIDLSGTVTISFKVKYYGTSSITKSSATINVLIGGSSGSTLLSGVSGSITTPTGLANYNETSWTQYSITLTTGSANSNIYFVGAGSSGYAYEIDDIVVQKAASASLAVSSSSLTGFTYPQGSGPSTAQTFTVSGTTLTAGSAITITAPTNYEVSTDGTNYASTATIANTAGGTLAATTVYARLASGLSQSSSITGNITVSGGGASTLPTVALTGSVTAPVVPTIITSSSTLTGFTYGIGSGPSTAQSINVSGSLLVAGSAITVTAPANYEVSLSSGSGYASSVTIANAAGGTLAATPIYARLKSGLSINTYNGNIVILGGGASTSQSVSVTGAVVATPLTAPTVGTPATATEDGFTASWSTVANATGGYIVNVYQGTTLAKTVTVSGQTSASTVINGLSSSTAYTYKVIAVGDGTNYSNSVESASSTSITTLTSSVVVTPACDITLYETDFTDWTAVAATSTSGNPISPQTTGAGKGYILTEDMTVTPSAGKLTSSSSERTIVFPAYTFGAGGKVIITMTNGTSTCNLTLTGSGSDGGITSTATLISGTGAASITGNSVIALGKSSKYQVVYTLPATVTGSVTLTLDKIRNEISGISVCTSVGTTTPLITTYPQPETTESTSAVVGGKTSTINMLLRGYNLTGDVTMSLVGTDAGYFSLPVTTVAASNWRNIAIVYTSSKVAQIHNAQLKLTSPGATDVYVDLVGISTPAAGTTPTILADTATIPFYTYTIAPTTNTLSIAGVNLTGDVTLTLTGTNAAQFSLSASSISKANATAGNTITITYTGDVNFPTLQNATLVISSPGATPVSIPLKGYTYEVRPTMYNLSFIISPSGSGSVSTSPHGTEFADGTKVTATVTPESGYYVTNWSDIGVSGKTVRTIQVGDKHKNSITITLSNVCKTCDCTAQGCSQASGSIVAYDVAQSQITDNSLTVSWSEVTGATYDVTVYNEDGSVKTTISNIPSGTTTTTITGLDPYTTYTYKVATVGVTPVQDTGTKGPYKTTGHTSICK